MSASAKRVRLFNLMQKQVIDTRGNTLGRISELVVNMSDGHIERATLRLIARQNGTGLTIEVPWSQFELAEDRQHLELDISLAVLRSVAAGRC